MIRCFDSTDLKLIHTLQAKAGDILYSLLYGGKSDLSLRLTNDPLPRRFSFTDSRAYDLPAQSSAVSLLVAKGPKLQLEIDDTKYITGGSESAGSLLLTETGAYITAKMSENTGFDEECWISLSTWGVVEHQHVGSNRVTFTTWRLVDNSQPNEKKIVVAFGDWDHVAA